LVKAIGRFAFDAKAVGLNFAGYTVVGEISRGGMGVILKVTHGDYERPLAMKLLHAQYHNSVVAQRFDREARVLRELDHPNIVKIYDYGVEDDVPFYVMEWIEGRSLDVLLVEHLKEFGQVPEYDWMANVFEGVADALAYCHENQIIHRDVKPGNIIVEQESLRPILVDFGIVRRMQNTDAEEGTSFDRNSINLSKTGEVHGTPAYMSPEQLEPGEFGDLTARSDVWGFGATLFQMLTGAAPYQHAGANFYLALLERDPPLAKSLNEDIPDWLENLCRRCLQRDSKRRPDMNRILSDLLSPGMARRDRVVPAALLFMVTVLLAVATASWFYIENQQQKIATRYAKVERNEQALSTQINDALLAMAQSFPAVEKKHINRLWEQLDQLKSSQADREVLASQLNNPVGKGKEEQSLAIFNRDLRAFELILKIQNNELDAASLAAESRVRRLGNESKRQSHYVEWLRCFRLLKAGRTSDALELLKRLRQVKLTETFALRALVQIQFDKKNWAQADILTTELLSMKGSSDQHFSLLIRHANIQIRLGKRDRARTILSEAIASGPPDTNSREGACRLALFLGQARHFSMLLKGASKQELEKPYAAIVHAWFELKSHHPGEARRLLAKLPFKHTKRFLKAYAYLIKANVLAHLFEINDSQFCLSQVAEFNSGKNTLLLLLQAKLKISNLLTDYETEAALRYLEKIENELHADLEVQEKHLLAEMNLMVGETLRFRSTMEAGAGLGDGQDYLEHALKLSGSREVEARLAMKSGGRVYSRKTLSHYGSSIINSFTYFTVQGQNTASIPKWCKNSNGYFNVIPHPLGFDWSKLAPYSDRAMSVMRLLPWSLFWWRESPSMLLLAASSRQSVESFMSALVTNKKLSA
jgi:serine/threonine protein kinase